jgi:hypothetical protein
LGFYDKTEFARLQLESIKGYMPRQRRQIFPLCPLVFHQWPSVVPVSSLRSQVSDFLNNVAADVRRLILKEIRKWKSEI